MVDLDGSGLTPALPSSNNSRRGPHRGCPPRSWQISLNLRIQLTGLTGRTVKMIGEPSQPFSFIPAQPAMHRLTGYPVTAGNLADRCTGDDLHLRDSAAP
jgi:hypothetical protein